MSNIAPESYQEGCDMLVKKFLLENGIFFSSALERIQARWVSLMRIGARLSAFKST